MDLDKILNVDKRDRHQSVRQFVNEILIDSFINWLDQCTFMVLEPLLNHNNY